MRGWIVAGAVLGLAGAGYAWRGGADEAVAFRSEAADRGAIVSTVSATGLVEPVALVQVGSQVSGSIARIDADFNDRVAADQVICVLDTTALRARADQDRANLARARARLRRIGTDLAFAERELERANALAADELIAAAERDRQEAERDALTAERDIADAEIAQAEASLAASEANLGYATIRSPIDGVVILRNVDVGQTVAASLQAPVLFEIAGEMGQVHVLASVSEADIGRIRAGQPASFTVDAYPDRRFEGAVRQIRLSPTVLQNVVTYTVVLSAANPDALLLPGMTANIAFETGRTPPDALRVPNTALRFEPDAAWIAPDATPADAPRGRGADGTRTVWIERDGLLAPVPVRTGMSDGRHTEILEGPLEAGQPVVLGVREPDGEGEEMTNPFLRRRTRNR